MLDRETDLAAADGLRTAPRGRPVHVLGTRGIPARHSGFESFAEPFCLYLADKGWDVTVYCQEDVAPGGKAGPVHEDMWNGVRRVFVPVTGGGPLSTAVFDWRSIRLAASRSGPCLVLGYNTAVLNLLLRLRGRRVLMNMDGIEWKRGKWSAPFKAWFWLNELAGCVIAQDLIADHPVIADHLATRARRSKIAMIPYAAPAVDEADPAPIQALGLTPGRYFCTICRTVPENSLLEVVQAFSRSPRDGQLAVLGVFDPDNAYHRAVRAAAGEGVVFPGAIYDKPAVNALRAHALAYCHGHTVGGTNPSLVEALGAGCPVIAHDNPYNRWVAGPEQFYFADAEGCAAHMTALLADPARASAARAAARREHAERFTFDRIHSAYEALLEAAV
jgi:glycosyltransferase involved in cell wall biosynthesis